MVAPATDEPIDAGTLNFPVADTLKRVPAKVSFRQNARNEKLETLEDLYAAFPSIGDGAWRLRITRTAPRNYNGMPIAGWLCDMDDKITMNALAEQFGGGRYDVAVIGPSGAVDADGNQPSRQQASIDIGINGHPLVGGDDMQQQPIRAGNYVGPEHPTIVGKRMAYEHEDRVYERQERAKAAQTPEYVVKALTEQNQQAITGVKEQATFNNQILRDQNDAYLKQIVAQNAEIKELGAKHMEFQVKAGETLRTAETTIAARLTAVHEQVLKTLVEAHRAEITSLKETYGKEISGLKDTHNHESTAVLQRAMADQTTKAEAHRNELSALREAHGREIAAASLRYQEDLTRRAADDQKALAAAKEMQTDRINDLRAAFERENKAIAASYHQTAEFSKENANNKIASTAEEMNRMRTRCETLERDNEKLRKDSIKDPMTFLMEAETVASKMLGMVRKEDIEVPDKEEEFDWKKELAKAAMGVVAKLPETAQKVTEGMAAVRERNAQIHAQAQAQAEGGQPRLQAGSRRRQVLAQAPWAGAAPPAHLGPVVADVEYKAPLPVIKREGLPGFAAEPPQPVPMPEPPAPVASAAPAQTVPQEQVDGFRRFVDELENAIRGEMVPPALFAKGLVDQVGVEQAKIFLAQTPVDSFFVHIESVIGDATTPILEKAGRDYTRAVWAAVAKIVEAA